MLCYVTISPFLSFLSFLSANPPSAGHDKTGERFEEGKPHAHDRLDGKDERSIANNLADAEHTEKKEKAAEEAHAAAIEDPTALARSHGNEPSKGAKKDKELVDDDAEILRRMEQSKADKKH
jgi:hypothetical protein